MYGVFKNSFLKIRNLENYEIFRASVTIQIIDFKKKLGNIKRLGCIRTKAKVPRKQGRLVEHRAGRATKELLPDRCYTWRHCEEYLP